jgi:NAD-dependent histone deacetylase SIR2
MAFSRELSKREKIPDYNTIDDAVSLLKKSKNIIVLTGAGISTSLGIPDFRSKDIGLYTKLEYLGLSDPQEVFDIDLFREDPSIFYSIAKDILPSSTRFSPTHAFIKLLQDKGKLLTNYSQNIDNLEGAAGVSSEKLIQCHGSFATASCVKCGAKVPGEAIFAEVKAGLIPRCKACIQRLRSTAAPAAMKRKRSKNGSEGKRRNKNFDESGDSSEGDNEYDLPAAGVMKPDITFFGEALPDTFGERLTKHDKDIVDLVIVIGTSLKVAPVSEVVPFLPAHIPQIYISREPVNHVNFDIDLLGDCDIVVAELCRRAGWDLQHEMIPENQKVDILLVEEFESRHRFVLKK